MCTLPILTLSKCFSEPIPRKGTETSVTTSDVCYYTQASFSEPIPRKGTETYTAV